MATLKLTRKELAEKVKELHDKIEKLEKGSELKTTLATQLDNKIQPALPPGTDASAIHRAGEAAANFAVDECVKNLVTERDNLYEQHDLYARQRFRKNAAIGTLVAAGIMGGIDTYFEFNTGSTKILNTTARVVRAVADFTSWGTSKFIGDRSQREYNLKELFHLDAMVEGDSTWYDFRKLTPADRAKTVAVRFTKPKGTTADLNDIHFDIKTGGTMSLAEIAEGVTNLITMAQFTDAQAGRVDPVKGYGHAVIPYILTSIGGLDGHPGISEADLLKAQETYQTDKDLSKLGVTYSP